MHETNDVIRRPSRLQALAELGANAQSSAEALDRIARVACRVLSVPVALVNLIGADRQQFVGCGGPEPWASMTGMPLDAGFCPFVLDGDAYTLEDARKVPAHAGDPAVELGVVAYAGVPLRAFDGEPIGTLCAVDFEPRTWSEDDLAIMADLAAGVIAELQLLTATRMIARDQVRLRSLAELSTALAPADERRRRPRRGQPDGRSPGHAGRVALARRRLGRDAADGRGRRRRRGGLRAAAGRAARGRRSPGSRRPHRGAGFLTHACGGPGPLRGHARRGLGGGRAAERGRRAAGGARRLLRRRARRSARPTAST